MQADRDRIKQIERDEAWLREQRTPKPAPAVVRLLKQAVRVELDLQVLRDRQDPAPSEELVGRLKERVRGELPDRKRHPPGRWVRWLVPAAAACLVLMIGLYQRSSGPANGLSQAEIERQLDGFIEALTEAVQEPDTQLVMLDEDLGALEGIALEVSVWSQSTADSALDALGQEMETLGEDLFRILEEEGDDV